MRLGRTLTRQARRLPGAEPLADADDRVEVEHATEIERPIEAVFAFIADARNDPQWCPRVISCVQIWGDGPSESARYSARHRPTALPTQTRQIDMIDCEPPHFLRSRQEDDNGVFMISYRLIPTLRGTHFVQSDEITWKIPSLIQPIAKRLVDKHISDQMRVLKRLMERGDEGR